MKSASSNGHSNPVYNPTGNETYDLKSNQELFDDHSYPKPATSSKTDDFEYKEGGWGWVVVIASAYCFGILYGMVGNYALIFNKFEQVYNETENHIFYAAWIGSISNGLQFILCLFGSFFVSFFNPRIVGILGGLISAISCLSSAFVHEMEIYFLTHGVILALGQAMLLASSLAILPHYFKARLSLANGIATCLSAIIIVLLPTFTSMILNHLGLQEAFYFLAVLNFISALCCTTYISLLPSPNYSSLSERVKEGFGLEVWKKPKFGIWCIATFFGMFGYLIPIVNIDHHSVHTFPEYNPVYINILFSASAGISAMIFGKIGDYTTFNRVHYHTFCFAIYGVVSITIPYASSFYVFIVQLIILGLMDGIWLSFKVPIACDLVESPVLGNQAIGYYHAIMMPMSIAGPAVAGKTFEMYGNYDLAFLLGGISCLICSGIIIIFIGIPDTYRMFKKKDSRENNDHSSSDIRF